MTSPQKAHTFYANSKQSHQSINFRHHSIISTRFDFSEFNEVLVPLHGCLQYVLPTNLTPLVSALTNSNLKNDSRLNNFHPTLQRLQVAIDAQKAAIVANPAWFTQTHHRRRVAARQSNVGLTQQMTLLPSMSTLPTLSVGDEEEVEEYRVEEDQSDKTPLIIQLETREADDFVEEEEGVKEKVEESTSVNEEELAPEIRVPFQQVYVKPPMDHETQDSGVYEDSQMVSDVHERLQVRNF